jgi:hypothetical protein
LPVQAADPVIVMDGDGKLKYVNLEGGVGEISLGYSDVDEMVPIAAP